MSTRATPTAESIGARWAGRHHVPSMQTTARVLGDVAVIAIALALAALIAVMLYAPMLP